MNEELINISKLSKKIGVPTHTLRFWEKKFHQIKPTILSGNRRYYSKKNIDTLFLIKFLLKEQGLTIKGTKKIIGQNINTLDEYRSSSIKAEYFKNKIKSKSKSLLNKIKSLKN